MAIRCLKTGLSSIPVLVRVNVSVVKESIRFRARVVNRIMYSIYEGGLSRRSLKPFSP